MSVSKNLYTLICWSLKKKKKLRNFYRPDQHWRKGNRKWENNDLGKGTEKELSKKYEVI